MIRGLWRECWPRIGYHSHAEAVRAAGRLRDVYADRGLDVTIDECRLCGLWHLGERRAG